MNAFFRGLCIGLTLKYGTYTYLLATKENQFILPSNHKIQWCLLLKKTFDMYYACKSYIYYNQKALHSNEWKKNQPKKRKVNCYSKDPNNLYIQERKERILVTKSNFNQKKKFCRFMITIVTMERNLTVS